LHYDSTIRNSLKKILIADSTIRNNEGTGKISLQIGQSVKEKKLQLPYQIIIF